MLSQDSFRFKVDLGAHEISCQPRFACVAAIPLVGVVGGSAFCGQNRRNAWAERSSAIRGFGVAPVCGTVGACVGNAVDLPRNLVLFAEPFYILESGVFSRAAPPPEMIG